MKKIGYLLLGVVLLFFLLPKDSEASEVRSVETGGSIGFTGNYSPVGTPDPTPIEGITPIDVTKPFVTPRNNNRVLLPKTNTLTSCHLVFFGVLLILTIGVYWFRNQKTREKEE